MVWQAQFGSVHDSLFLIGVPGTFNWASRNLVARLVSTSPGGLVIGRLPDGSWPKLVVARRISRAILVLWVVESGSLGGLVGDTEEGVCHLISSMCWDSWFKALSRRL